MKNEACQGTTGLLQNLPAPSGSLETLTQNYDEERFFALPAQGVWGLGRAMPVSAFTTWYHSLRNRLKELGFAPEYSSISEYYTPSVGIPDDLTLSMRNWLVLIDRKDSTPPIEFNILRFQPSLETLRFCLNKGILRYLGVAGSLVEKHFPTIQELYMAPEQDPESGEEWINLEITIKGDMEEVLTNYDSYTDEWILAVDWPERNNIRLSYNVVSE